MQRYKIDGMGEIEGHESGDWVRFAEIERLRGDVSALIEARNMLLGEIRQHEPLSQEDHAKNLAELQAAKAQVLKAVHHLLNVWQQYGGSLEHRNMGAGEDAAEFLEALGLGHDQGYQFELNDAGRKVMDGEL